LPLNNPYAIPFPAWMDSMQSLAGKTIDGIRAKIVEVGERWKKNARHFNAAK
jgi:hypothetical protein